MERASAQCLAFRMPKQVINHVLRYEFTTVQTVPEIAYGGGTKF